VIKATLLVVATILPIQTSAQDRPNILLIVADAMDYTDVGAYGSESLVSLIFIGQVTRRRVR